MGRVELVEDSVTGKRVALKLIGGPGVDVQADKTLLQFKQEFRLMTRLRHPNCCEVYDYGVDEGGAPYFTMEVVPGQGLDEMLPLPPERFTEVFAQLLRALGYVHRLGFVHLDLKSANVRVMPDGTVKLMDYGLMEVAGQGGLPIRGTLPYIAPEVIRRAPLDGRADLYSAGVLAFELLTGRYPFERPTAGEVLRAHLNDSPPVPSAIAPAVPPELDRLVRRLLAKEPTDRPATADDVLADLGVEPPPGLGGTLLVSPIVGRDGVVAGLQTGVARVRDGHGHEEVWLWGPPGVGKSRLLDEVRCHAQLENIPFVRVASHEVGGAPYATLTSVLRSLMPGFRAGAASALADQAAVLAVLLPELGAVPAPPLDTPRAEALRLQAAVTGLLGAYAAAQPFVLVIEDWRGVDAPSREVLAYVRRNAAKSPFMLIASTRRGRGADGGPDEMPERPLEGLADADLARMLAGMLGESTIAPGFVARVAELTGGVPREVEQLLDHLVKAGRLTRTNRRWSTDVPIDANDLPSGSVARWARLLAELPPEAGAVLMALTAIGRPIGLEFLQAVTSIADETLFEALEALLRRRLIQRDGQGAYGFVRREDPEALAGIITPEECRHAHGRAAATLEGRLAGQLLADAPLELVSLLAFHGLEAGLGVRALPWALEAGRRALALYALADAGRYLKGAAAVLEGLPPEAAAPARFECARLLADVERHAGRAADAEPLYGKAIALAESAGDRQALGGLFTSLANVYQILGRYDEAIAAADRSLSCCLEARDEAGAARCLQVRARAHFFQGDTAAAIRDCGRAIAHGKAADSPIAAAVAAAGLGYYQTAGDPAGGEAGLAHLREALAIFEAHDDRAGLMIAHNYLGNALTARGDFVAAARSFEVCRDLSVACGSTREEAFALVNLAILALETGEPAQARAVAARARGLAERLGAKLPQGMTLAIEGQACAVLGDWAGAIAGVDEALALARSIGNRYLEALLLPRQAEVYLMFGKASQARLACDALRALIAETGNKEMAGRLDLLDAHLARLSGERARADELARRVASEARLRGERALQLDALFAQAQGAADAGEWERTNSLAAEGLALARALGALGREAELLGLRGLAALREGTDKAVEHFTAMEAWAEGAAAPLALAAALFGRAAAAPFAEQAAARAGRAKAILEEVAGRLTEPDRAAFLARPDRQAILGGDFRAHGQPVARPARSASGPLGMEMGGFGPM